MLICFALGFSARLWFVRSTAPESPRDSNSSTDTQAATASKASVERGSPIEPTAGIPWYDKDYSGNWNDLLDIIASKPAQDEEFRGLFSRISDWTDADKISFLRAAFAHNKSEYLESVVRTVLFSLALKSPQAGLNFLNALPPVDQNEYGFSVVNGLIQSDPQFAWEWLNQIESDEVESGLGKNKLPAFRFMLISVMSFDPKTRDQALELAYNAPGRRERETLVGTVVKAMVNHDPENAIAQTEKYPEIESVVMDNVIRFWAEESPRTAANYLLERPELISRQRVVEVAKSFISNKDDAGFSEFYHSLESERMKSFLAYRAATSNASHNVPASIEWVKTIEDGQSRQQAAMAAINEMGYSDTLENQVELIESAFQGYDRERLNLYLETLQVWQDAYPEKVNDIVKGLPEKDRFIRDTLESTLAPGLKQN